MALRRRNFLGLALGVMLPGKQVLNKAHAAVISIDDMAEEIAPNSIVEVKAGQKLTLPKNVAVNDCVYVVISPESLENPAVIKFSGAKILNTKDDLVLDTFANIKLIYKGGSEGWII